MAKPKNRIFGRNAEKSLAKGKLFAITKVIVCKSKFSYTRTASTSFAFLRVSPRLSVFEWRTQLPRML
jgi:hypothetical protein